jgi:hypothetical protein
LNRNPEGISRNKKQRRAIFVNNGENGRGRRKEAHI